MSIDNQVESIAFPGPKGDITAELQALQQDVQGSASAAALSQASALASAGTATTAAGTATTKAGEASASATASGNAQTAAEAARDAAQGYASTASTAAGTATTQAGIATTQAVEATTQAGIATTQAGLAATSKTGADAAQVAAELARDAANVLGRVYVDTAAGLAATTNGQYFSVPVSSSNDSLILYKNNASSALEITRYPSSTGVRSVAGFVGAMLNYGSLKERNLYEPGNYVTGKLILGATGAEATNASYSSTGYIPVVAGRNFIMNAASFGSAPNGYAFYDHNRVFISGGTTSIAANTATAAPTGAAYIRMSWAGTTGPDVKTFMFMVADALPSGFRSAQYRDAVASDVAAAQRWRDYMGVVNLFDPTRATDGFLITSGVESASATHYITDYMPVEAGGYVTFSHSQTTLTGNRGAQFYDKDRVYLSALASPIVANTPYSVPAQACYVRTTYSLTAQKKSDVMVVQGQTMPSVYVPFGFQDTAYHLPRARNLSIAARPSSLVNLFDKTLRTTGNLIVSATGAYEVNASYFVTGYIPVTPSGTFTISPASSGITAPRGLCYFDAARNYISGVNAPFTDGQVFTVPSNAFYVRISASNTQLNTLIVLEGSQTPGHIATHTLATVADARPWTNKKWAIMGDSISANTNWMATATATMQGSVGLFAALAGRKMVDALKTPAGVALTSSDFTTIDAALLWLGTNDIAVTTLGTITDATSAATFYGQTKLAVETLLTWKPTLRLVLATILYRTSGTPALFSQAIRDVAALYSLPVLDFEKTSGVNSVTAATFLSDGLHPNATGYSACVVPTAVGFFETLRPAS